MPAPAAGRGGAEAAGRGRHAGAGFAIRSTRTLLAASPCDARMRASECSSSFLFFPERAVLFFWIEASTSASPGTAYAGLCWARKEVFEE